MERTRTETMSTNLSLKVDVDTLRGHNEGVPRLLELFARLKIRASFFFSMGPDNSGKAIRRIFRRGFLEKMWRTKAPSTYGLKTLLYGTLLPAPLIASQSPLVIKRTVTEGHECGTHAWDHVEWQDTVKQRDACWIDDELDRARSLFEQITGTPARGCAAPGWQISALSLQQQDHLGLLYASDVRGTQPFFPRCGERSYETLQIPTTLPTLDELLGAPEMTEENILSLWREGLKCEFNVLTIHAEMEGLSQLPCLERFLERCLAEGVSFLTLEEVALRVKSKSFIPTCEVLDGEIKGRAGTLAIQHECQ